MPSIRSAAGSTAASGCSTVQGHLGSQDRQAVCSSPVSRYNIGLRVDHLRQRGVRIWPTSPCSPMGPPCTSTRRRGGRRPPAGRRGVFGIAGRDAGERRVLSPTSTVSAPTAGSRLPDELASRHQTSRPGWPKGLHEQTQNPCGRLLGCDCVCSAVRLDNASTLVRESSVYQLRTEGQYLSVNLSGTRTARDYDASGKRYFWRSSPPRESGDSPSTVDRVAAPGVQVTEGSTLVPCFVRSSPCPTIRRSQTGTSVRDHARRWIRSMTPIGQGGPGGHPRHTTGHRRNV